MLVWSPAGLVVLPLANTPGYWAGEPAVGRSAVDWGNVTGRCPEGSASPNSSAASAGPCCTPGYQASRTLLTWLSHGIRAALPVSSTTMVLGLAAATAEMSASPPL